MGGVDALHQHDHARRVIRLREERHAALELRVEEVLDGVELAPGLARVVADADRARLPRQREVAVGVVADRLQVRHEVLGVRDVLLVDRSDIAVAHPARGHVVRERDDVAADRLARRQLLADLPEELEVVVDVLDVLDVTAVLLVERLQDGLVDVERPVGERPVADRDLRVVDGGRGLLAGALALHATAGSEERRPGTQEQPGPGEVADELAARVLAAIEHPLDDAVDVLTGHAMTPVVERRTCGRDPRPATRRDPGRWS